MAACILIRSDDGKILAVSRKNDPNDFGLPGGKVDEGETPEEAAARELGEETGLDVTNLKQVYDRYDGGHHCYCFVGNVSGTIDTDEAGVIRWVSPEVLLTQSRYAPYNRELFKRVGIVVKEQRVVKLSVGQVRAIIKEEATRKSPLSAYQVLEMIHKDNTLLSSPGKLFPFLERIEKEQFDAGYDAGHAAALRGEEDDEHPIGH
jgi:hypothetical protein